MDQYTSICYASSKLITNAYSTSFGLSIRLFSPTLRPHIYAIYGLVRVADEIVDSYRGVDQREQLDQLEQETKHAIRSGYSTNPIVHAFAQTARRYDISASLIAPFFKSMRMDLTQKRFTQTQYETYIYGSAEVIGLLCLKVFTGDKNKYDMLEAAAKKLGSAYQKVNFLRDIAADSDELGRWYFPMSSKASFDEATKLMILQDIEHDFAAAKTAINQLPASSQKAVALSYRYYRALTQKITRTPANTLLKKRVHIPNGKKIALLVQAATTGNPHA